MSIYFRVHEDAQDPVGTLYNRQFKVTSVATAASDLVLTTPPALFDKLRKEKPDNLIIRVHEDKSNKNPAEGTYYTEDFRTLNFNAPLVMPPGPTMILTITPDEFDAMRMMKK